MKQRRATSPAKFGFLHALLADPEVSAPAKVVATTLVLKFHNSKTGRCNPSVASIAAAVGRNRRNVFPSIEELADAGWLKVVGTKGGAPGSTNSFVFDLSQRVSHPSPLTDDENVTPTGDEDSTPTSDECDTGDENCREGCRARHTNQEEPLSPTERECVGDSASDRAPDGALTEKFEQLCQTWRKPDGVNRKAAWKAYVEVCEHHDGDQVLASAERWVASTPERFLKKLEVWLGNGAWLNEPPSRQHTSGRGGKPNPVDEMLNAGGFERYQR